MYSTGSHIVYGRSGVCKVCDIVKRKNPADDTMCNYYVLQPLGRKGTIYTPADNPKVFMRPVISAEEANSLIDRISSIKPEKDHHKSTQQLVEHYRSLIGSHDCADLIGLVISAHAKQEYAETHNRNFGHIDKQFMDQASDLISTEFAMALGIPKEDVDGYIANRVEDANA